MRVVAVPTVAFAADKIFTPRFFFGDLCDSLVDILVAGNIRFDEQSSLPPFFQYLSVPV